MEQGIIIISILIVLFSFALVATVDAANTQATVPGSWGNGTSHMAYNQSMMTNGGSMRGQGHMMQGYGNGRGMRGSTGAMHSTGGVHAGFMFVGIILAGLLMLVWLVVGILVIVLLLRKLKKDKTP